MSSRPLSLCHVCSYCPLERPVEGETPASSDTQLTPLSVSSLILAMRRMLLTLALPLAVFASLTSLSTRASADVPPESKCKCSTLGAPVRGGLAASLLGVSLGLLLVRRRERR